MIKTLKAKFSEGGSADAPEKTKRGWPVQVHKEFF
jgi:hypothetical protein